MQLVEYQKFIATTALFPKQQTDPIIAAAMYCALGMTGEAGEASEHIKKWHRDGVINKEAAALELGDVLWYVTRLADTLGYSLEDILNMNVKKLQSRRERNQIKGSGDNR